MGNALLPIGLVAAAFLLLGGNKAAAATAAPAKAAPKGKVTLGTPSVIKRAPAKAAPKAAKSEAVQAAELAERQLGAPNSKAVATVSKNVAQVVSSKDVPAGYSSVAASAKAQPLADHIRTKKGKYDRAVLQSFQTSAGLTPDGKYGPQSAAALRFFGAKNVPGALFKGSATNYAPPKGA